MSRAGFLLPLPLVVAGLLFATQGPASRSTSPQLSFGPVAARAAVVPMPAMADMMMPMAEGGQQGDEVQVTLQLRNDTDAVVTVPFGRVRVIAADGSAVAPSEGLQGDLVLRPHSAAEERLRFPAGTSAAPTALRLNVPDGSAPPSDDHLLTLPVQR